MTLRWVWLTAFEHTRRGLRPWRTFGTNVCCFLPCQTFVPNVRHGVLARHDAYVLWVRPLDISEGLRPSVNMQWDLSEVLLGATPSQYKNAFAACWSLHVGHSLLAGPYMCGVRSLRTHCMRPYMWGHAIYRLWGLRLSAHSSYPMMYVM